MGWKTEKWLNELFPGQDRIYAEYRELPTRELVIVAAAVLDTALAELIAKRFLDSPKESESFLGVNGDGRAPAASFGARIQLAVLIGILTPKDAEILRAIKNLRNIFAHRVRASFLSEPASTQTKLLLEKWRCLTKKLIQAGVLNGAENTIDEIGTYLESHSEAGEGLLLAVFSTYQAYFHLLESRVSRIKTIRRKST